MVYLWSYIAGLLTMINPCVLPLLPIIIASALQASKFGPLALAMGLVASFTVFGVSITAFGHLIGLDEQRLNQIAAIMMIVFGIILLIPRASTALASAAKPLADKADSRINHVQNDGLAGQAMIGVLLGAVWSPCVGPTLGGAIALANSGENLLQATLVMLVFGLGVASILLALAYGSREMVKARGSALERIMPYAKPIMGVTLLIVGLSLIFQLHHYIEIWFLDNMPVWLQDLSVRF